ncbi:uncharacterized protein LOC114250565 [Bombyx mandarina]|uniref:Uncharacterized protein LOC114250565 n=1 Tax=Bombyx mandarina TaxID=7092 RepID=A0A6J2KJB1_BOMMA|nr:uncharacterized protein LOC114250565 [Bombyx mandarina]
MDFKLNVFYLLILILSNVRNGVSEITGSTKSPTKAQTQKTDPEGVHIPIYGVVLISITIIILCIIIICLGIAIYKLKNNRKETAISNSDNNVGDTTIGQNISSTTEKYVKLKSLKQDMSNYDIHIHSTSTLSLLKVNETDTLANLNEAQSSLQLIDASKNPLQSMLSEELRKKFELKKQKDIVLLNEISEQIKGESIKKTMIENVSILSDSGNSKRIDDSKDNHSGTEINDTNMPLTSKRLSDDAIVTILVTGVNENNDKTVPNHLTKSDVSNLAFKTLQHENNELLKVKSSHEIRTEQQWPMLVKKKESNAGLSRSACDLTSASSFMGSYDELPSPLPLNCDSKKIMEDNNVYHTIPRRRSSVHHFFVENYDILPPNERISYVEPSYCNAKTPKLELPTE